MNRPDRCRVGTCWSLESRGRTNTWPIAGQRQRAQPPKLSARLRQTLACLLEGDSEKQVAARLSLSHATTHQYLTALYRHFGVQSRAQLQAYVCKRSDESSGSSLRPPEAIRFPEVSFMFAAESGFLIHVSTGHGQHVLTLRNILNQETMQ
jgi:DNA-binding CsgD family transcriptional regulator